MDIGSFLIGSSFPVFAPFFYRVSQIPNAEKNYSYGLYSFIAPLYFGVMNMIIMSFGMPLRIKMILAGFVSSLIVFTIAYSTSSYNYTEAEWLAYYLRILSAHMLTYNVTLYLLNSWFRAG